MNARMILASAVAAAFGVAIQLAVAKSPDTLDGWGPYKFGMTMEQVLKVSNGEIDEVDYSNQDMTTNVLIGPYLVEAVIHFSSIYNTLQSISLEAQGFGSHDCAGSNAYFLKRLTAKYGNPTISYGSSVTDDDGDEKPTFDWNFQNRTQIEMTPTAGDHCATASYSPLPTPAPSVGF